MRSEPMTRRLCLVTGASAGIGAAFAQLYAAKGYDLVLTARRGDRLEALARDLRRDHAADVTVIPADLADSAAVADLLSAIIARGRGVDTLINNAGYGLPGGYANTDWIDQAALLQVMLVSLCELTHRLLPGMIERGFGRILNVASLAGQMPGGPGHTLYGATKAFVVRFSQSLHLEVKDQGVHVCALCPGFTRTEFHDVNHTRERIEGGLPGWVWMDAETVARAGHAAVEANRAVCTPGAVNQALAAMAKLTPETWTMAMMGRGARRFRRV